MLALRRSSWLLMAAAGGDAGRVAAPAPTPPEFGSVRRREQRRSERAIRDRQAQAQRDYVNRLVARPTAAIEAEARRQVVDGLRFREKPPSCVFFRQFLSELRRYEVHWADASPGGGGPPIVSFELLDRGLDGLDGDSPQVLCRLRADLRACAPINGYFDALTAFMLHTTDSTAEGATLDPHEVPFQDEFRLRWAIEFTPVLPLAGGGFDTVAGGGDAVEDEDEEEGLFLSPARERAVLEATLREPYRPRPGFPSRRYMHRVDAVLINKQSGARQPLFRGVSVQACGYFLLASLPRFLRHGGGARLFSRDATSMLRFQYATVAQQIGLVPSSDIELCELIPS